MNKNNARDKIIAQLKEAQNVLITVSDNPSVDELAAALGLTLAINKAEKHATAVASGKMPDALEFLNPNKTFETSVDSLRDFIIALNKEKADHLRYKLVGDHVKIFITPYRSIITENDLEFEQGDFNVDFVLALGVHDKDHLDGALAAHGRIFHDASVGVLTTGETASTLSELNWHSPQSSSLSEMVLEIIESDSIGKKSLTKSVATAILTGIVAETERFSNEKANAKVMNLASKLIMSGADQQLVISKLKEAEEKSLRKEIEDQAANFKISENSEEETIEEKIETVVEKPKKKDASVLTIERENNAEEELENSLSEMSAQLDEPNPELQQIADLAVDFPAVAEVTPIDNQPVEISENLDAEPQINFEETPAPAQIESPVENIETTAPQIVEEIPQVVAPVENYAPEIPAPMAEFEQPNAFIAENPVEAIAYEAAPQTEIAPISNEEIQPEIPAEQPQSFGAREYVGDDYYNPEKAQNIAQAIQGSIHDTNANDVAFAAPEVSSRGVDLVPPTLGMQAETAPAMNFEQNFDAPQTFENPVQNFDANIPAQGFGGFPPPVPDFSAMPLPPELPPVPNFENIDFNAMPAPVQPVSEQEFNFEPAQTIPDVALGSSGSSSVMVDQIYPADPSQFKIPGM